MTERVTTQTRQPVRGFVVGAASGQLVVAPAPPTLPPAAQPPPQQAARFDLAFLKRWSSPIRWFGATKAALFGAFCGALFAVKVYASATPSQWLLNLAMSELTTGQMAICAATVVSLVGANLYALIISERSKERRRRDYLSVIASPLIDDAVRNALLPETRD